MKIHANDIGILVDDKMYPYEDIAYIEMKNSLDSSRLFAINVTYTSGMESELYRAVDKKKVIEIFDQMKYVLTQSPEFEDLNSMILNIGTLTDVHVSVDELNKQCLLISFDGIKRFLNIKNRRKSQELIKKYKLHKSTRVDEVKK
ncbi:MAG: hypothetical protein ACLRFL_02425 [Clostridia bacterium]